MQKSARGADGKVRTWRQERQRRTPSAVCPGEWTRCSECDDKAAPARHQYTWCAPEGTHHNQTDFILLPQTWLPSVGKCKTCPNTNADTDHTLVQMKFKLKLRKLPKANARPCFDFSQKELELELKKSIRTT